jgi:capsular polysaccharide transport system permease protein
LIVTEAVSHPTHVWLNVINAILLRDIRVRAGKFYTGYLVIFLMPFLHLGVVLTFFVLADRIPPVGTQPVIFFGLSILPFVVFLYPSRQIVVGLTSNRPLLYFPRVRIVDVIIARGLLETANGIAVSAFVCFVLFVIAGEFSPRDPFGIVCSILLTLYLGCAWGFANALVTHVFHFWNYGFNILFPLIWILSGIIFNPHALSSPYKEYLAFNPLLHCIEFIRYSYYYGYQNDIIDVWYVFWIATCMMALALFIERTSRRVLLSS